MSSIYNACRNCYHTSKPEVEGGSDLQSWSRLFSAWTASWREVGFHREYLMYLHAKKLCMLGHAERWL